MDASYFTIQPAFVFDAQPPSGTTFAAHDRLFLHYLGRLVEKCPEAVTFEIGARVEDYVGTRVYTNPIDLLAELADPTSWRSRVRQAPCDREDTCRFLDWEGNILGTLQVANLP